MTNFTPRSGEGGWGAARADLIWDIERVSGAPADLLAAGIPSPARRLLRWCVPDRTALVIGSAQPVPPNCAAVVVRRRSGGAGVLVAPGRLLWADVVLPAGDPLWERDVGVAPLWLGRAWAAALRGLGVPDPEVHTGPMVRTPWSATVCFAGRGPGEVMTGGRKIVGICQRRTREATLFQCAALLRWEPQVAELADVAVGVWDLVDCSVDALQAALEGNMP
ncbi:MAG: hypothetical protein ACYDH6_11255 [Acidimicrobiales bacterium]